MAQVDRDEEVRAKAAQELAKANRQRELDRRAAIKKAQEAADKSAYRPLVTGG